MNGLVERIHICYEIITSVCKQYIIVETILFCYFIIFYNNKLSGRYK